ncbi:MAG: PSD1 and planctomycete cytochrome C domain-containing protein [Pirellula sp.]
MKSFHLVHALVYCLVICLCMVATGSSVSADVDFNRSIRPILAEHCFHCHGPDASQRAADLRLDVEQDAHRSAIDVATPDASELLQRVCSDDPEMVMPPPQSGKKLTKQEVDLLRQWISEGAKYSAHWAFQPIRDSNAMLATLPEAAPEQTPIDRFLLSKLAISKLDYSPEINRQQLIRRMSFDLIGLPPTWQEVEAFANDSSPRYLDNLIDRLLASPQYGERWGRHWLDVARYADTHGGAAIGFTKFPFSYTYRDYVIGAMNNDLPFDRFILEQIAADQLALSENDPSQAALGFLTVGMQFRNYHDTLDDQIDVITRGLMGLTVTCARCHDHKFDDISIKDYYGIYASIAPSKSPTQLPVIGAGGSESAQQEYQQQLQSMELELRSFVREQAEVLRGRMRMQVGLYLGEIAKGAVEADTSTAFLSYRTDDIRPVILNRWLKYLTKLKRDDPVFGPWLEMQSWGKLEPEEFAKRCDEYLALIAKEIEQSERDPAKIHSLHTELPKRNLPIWDALIAKKPRSLSDVATVYGSIFTEAQRNWLKAIAEASDEASSPERVLPDEHAQHQAINSPVYRQLRQHLYGPDSPFSISDDDAMGLANRTVSDRISAKRGSIHQLHLSAAGSPPRAMVLREDPTPSEHYVFLRGNPLSRGEQVQPRFLSALDRGQVKTFESGKRRLGLAQSIIDRSNPLTARVIVNWAWQNHFGVGLVRTPDDFGTRGQPPTHPELLDYLADEFQKNGWSLKWLHKQILNSRAYRQGAIESEASRRVDPDNLLLWRMPRKRLEFESMRDAMLSVSEELDLTKGGRPIDLDATPAIPRRSVYGFINRDIIANLMSTFDSANPNACTAKRPETTVPQQTLFALNSEFIQDRAAKLASLTNLATPQDSQARITDLVRRILGRNPTEIELNQADVFLREYSKNRDAANETAGYPETAWTQLAHALLASNEFLFLD